MENETIKQVWKITDANKSDTYNGGWIYIGTEEDSSDIEINYREGGEISTVSEAIKIALEICELLNSKNRQDGN
jgi:hypothetical protein